MTSNARAIGIRLPTTERAPRDYYVTPEWAVRSLVPVLAERLRPMGRILDAGCGSGAIMRVLAETWPHVYGVDLEPQVGAERAYVADFLTREWSGYEAIVMNPPYGVALDFVRHALAQVSRAGRPVVAALLPLDWLATQGRAAFWREYPADVLVLDRRPSFSIGGRPTKGTASTNYMWAIWPAGGAVGRILRDTTWRQEGEG